jgi:dienelactone hydrolase
MDQNAQLLRARVMAAIQALLNVTAQSVASHQIAAMGFCLGGQPILELANASREHRHFLVAALITFHGVFARETPLSTMALTRNMEDGDQPNVLICNGDDDPFVAPKEIEAAGNFFRANGFAVEVFRVANAKHGFTNPAQDMNPNPAFGFSPDGSVQAWTRALGLLRSTTLFRN